MYAFQRLEAVRGALGWVYADLANFFGVSTSTAHAWCRGIQPIPPAVEAAIAALEEVAHRQTIQRRQEVASNLIGLGVIGLIGWIASKMPDDLPESTGSKGKSTGTASKKTGGASGKAAPKKTGGAVGKTAPKKTSPKKKGP